MQQVEHASLHQLLTWWRFNPGPGMWAIGHEDHAVFEKALKEEAKIIERIGERIKELGGITPGVSKAVGWDRRSSMEDIPKDVMNKFYGLANDLSPENLFCDGERSHAEAMAAQRQIMREWANLERRVGRKVTVEEVETERMKSYRRGSMNDAIAARELMAAAQILSMDFPTQDAMNKYLKDHPDADKSNHKVVKTEKKPWEDSKWEPPKAKDGYDEPDPDDPDKIPKRDYAKELKKYGKGTTVDSKLFKSKDALSKMMWNTSNGKDHMDLLKGALDGGHPIPEKLLDDAIKDAMDMIGSGTTVRILKKIKERHEKGEGVVIPLIQPDKKDVAASMEVGVNRIAADVLILARELLSIDFPTKDAMDKYLKDHPDADHSNHRVVETKKELPSKKDLSKENYPTKSEVEKADLKSLKEWDDGLGEPGAGSKGTPDFGDDLAEEKDIRDHIRRRIKELSKDELDDDLKGFSHQHGISKNDGGKWAFQPKGEILKKVKSTVDEYEKILKLKGYDKDTKDYARRNLPRLKDILKKYGAG
jgi:hypothetical protein